MIAISNDSNLLVGIVALSCAFEFLRIVIAYLIGKPSNEIQSLGKQKLEALEEITKIKSIQLEFVRHSLLNRKVIKFEKQIEQLQAEYAPRAQKIKKTFRIIRIVTYVGIGIALANYSALSLNPQLLWPISVFTSQTVVDVPIAILLLLLGTAWRHIFRSILPVLFRKTVFP